jgi:uncharacterized damage-inducible protein DinB
MVWFGEIMDISQIFSHWKQIRVDLLSIIDKFNDVDLAYIPFNTSWSVGQIMLHIADAEDGWFRYAVTQELDQWPEQYCLENYPQKEDIKSALAAVHSRTEHYLESLSDADTAQMVIVPWRESIPLL